MFSLFRGSGSVKTASVVHADVGAQLRPEKSFPAAVASVGNDDGARCKKVAVDGVPPSASFLDASRSGETAAGYVVRGPANAAPLAIVNISGAHPRFEIWDLTADATPKFAHKRNVQLDAAQASWQGFLSLGVACLPANKLLFGVAYYAPQVKESLFLYDIGSGVFSSIARVAPHTDNYDKFYEVRDVGSNAAIVLYYSGRTRDAPEIYHNAYNHLFLVSTRYPQGIEIVKLGIDDGNVGRWAFVDRTVWLQTIDKRDARKPIERFWSLDLSKVL